MVQSHRKNYQLISCHTSPCSQPCGLLSYGCPRLRKRLFRKATWTSSNSHKILLHLRSWRLNSNPSSFQRRRSMTASACIMSVVCRSAYRGWTWGPAMSRETAEAEWDGSLCHQVTAEKSFRKTSQTSRTDFIFLFCRLWEDIGMRWRLSWERWEISLGRNLSKSKHEDSLLSIELYRFDCWFEFFLKKMKSKSAENFVFYNQKCNILQMAECNYFIFLLQLAACIIEKLMVCWIPL